MDRTGEIGMNKTINYPAPKWQDKCPDCGFKCMNIWKHGRIHCGKCLAGGHFTANKYKSIKDKYFKKKQTGDNGMISKEFTCKCGKQKGWITENKETQPCHICGRKYKGVYNSTKLTIDAIELTNNNLTKQEG